MSSLCEHLRPIIQHLNSLDLDVTPFSSPYGDTTHASWRAISSRMPFPNFPLEGG